MKGRRDEGIKAGGRNGLTNSWGPTSEKQSFGGIEEAESCKRGIARLRVNERPSWTRDVDGRGRENGKITYQDRRAFMLSKAGKGR